VAGQVIVNEAAYSLFVKAGHNAEQHNHNDVGSCIISTDRGQIFCDLGAGVYTRQYFKNETRYTIFCNSSLGHSVPIVNGESHKFGARYKGCISHCSNRITVEMAGAYGLEALQRFTRTLEHSQEGVILTDRFSEGVRVCERFVTLTEPLVEEDCVRVANVRLGFDPSVAALNVKKEHHATHQGALADVWCIDFEIGEGETAASFSFLVE
jgi:hypothetical protein